MVPSMPSMPSIRWGHKLKELLFSIFFMYYLFRSNYRRRRIKKKQNIIEHFSFLKYHKNLTRALVMIINN